MSDSEMTPEKSAAIKATKVPIWQGCINYFPRALMEVAKVSEFGAKKHGFQLSDKGFLHPGYTQEMYEDAIARHIVGLITEGEVNVADGNLLHRAQRAWNALASLEKYLIQVEQEKANGI